MKYVGAIKGGLIFLIIFIILAIIIPIKEPLGGIDIILTASTFLFAILAGFYISRLDSRLEKIRAGISNEDSNLLTFYETAKFFGKKFQDRVKKIINKYYIVAYDFIDSAEYYKECAPHFFTLYDELDKIKGKKIPDAVLGTFDDALNNLNKIEENRNDASEHMAEKLPLGVWFVLSILAIIVIFSIFSLRVPALYSNIITIFLSTALVLILLIMRDLQNLRIGNRPIIVESGLEVLEFMGELRYYNKKHIDRGFVKIPKNIKEYRLGIHEPGAKKFTIKIIKK